MNPQTTTRIPKITLPSPSLRANFWSPQRSRAACPTLENFLADVVDFLRQEVVELVRRARARRLLLEREDSRSGSFEPLKKIPEVKLVVPGLITTERPRDEPISRADREREPRLVVQTARRVRDEDAALRSPS